MPKPTRPAHRPAHRLGDLLASRRLEALIAALVLAGFILFGLYGRGRPGWTPVVAPDTPEAAPRPSAP